MTIDIPRKIMEATSRSRAGVESQTKLQVRRLSADHSAPSAARLLVRELDPALPPETVERAALAASELVTNAVIHGSPDAGEVVVRVQSDGAGLGLEVSDAGGRFHEPRSGGGLGLRIVDRLADEWSVHSRAGWLVRAMFRPRPTGPGDR